MKWSAPLLLPIPLAGCAGADMRYPSLGPRAAERIGFEEPAVAAPAPVVADPALDTRLAELGGQLDVVTRGFAGDASRAERAGAASGARTVGSDAWLDAQTALAALDDWRAQTTGVASDLEALAGERAASVGTPYPALEALRARAAAEAERQSGIIATLGSRLPQP